jgi:hypothetical protein
MNAKIYKIESLILPHIYIGVTTKKYLSERFTYYRREYNKYVMLKGIDADELKRYIHIKIESGNEALIILFKLFDKYGIKNFKINLIDEIEYKSPDYLKSKLFEYIKNLDCVNKKTLNINNSLNNILQ